MGAVGTDITYTIAVEDSHLVTDCYRREIEVAKVEWRTYVYEGDDYQLITAYAADGGNRTWNRQYDEIPEWVPEPPKAWFDLADEIAAQVSQS